MRSCFWIGMTGLFIALMGGLFSCDAQLRSAKRCDSNAECDLKDNLGRLTHQCDPKEKVCVPIKPCRFDSDCGDTGIIQCVNQQCIVPSFCNHDIECRPNEQCVIAPNEKTNKLEGTCVLSELTDELSLLYLKFDQLSPTPKQVFDSSPRIHHGAWEPDGSYEENGYIGKAGIFDADKTAVRIPHNADFLPLRLTVSAWIKLSAPSQGGNILRKNDIVGLNGYALEISKKGFMQFQVADKNNRHICTGLTAIPTGQWTHLAGSYDGQHVRCFLNGKLESSTDWDGQLTDDGTPDLFVGGKTANGDFFSGLIDEAKLFGIAQKAPFTPDLTRFLYVAGESKTIHAIDARFDVYDSTQNIELQETGHWPIGLSPSGKYLYLWHQGQQKLSVVDTSTKKLLVQVDAPNSGLKGVASDQPPAGQIPGALASVNASEKTLWLWGNTTYVFPLEFGEHPKAIATIPGFSDTFASDVAYLPQENVYAVSDLEKKQLLAFDAKGNKSLGGTAITSTVPPGQKPLAMATLPDEKQASVLHVSMQDATTRKVFRWDGKAFKQETGGFAISETTTDSSGAQSTKDHKIHRLLGVGATRTLYYTFFEPRMLYRLDVGGAGQTRIETWLEASKQDGKATYKERKVEPFVSLYFPHLHSTGKKLYFQSGNSGLFYVLDAEKPEILKTISIGVKTAPYRLPIAGVNHPSQAY